MRLSIKYVLSLSLSLPDSVVEEEDQKLELAVFNTSSCTVAYCTWNIFYHC